MRLRLLLTAGLLALIPACGGAAPSSEDAGPGSDGGHRDAATRSCFVDEDCNDGFYCNGAERCMDGLCARMPVACDDGVACTRDVCNETTHACTSRAPDEDGDGFGDATCTDALGTQLGNDCDDTDPTIYPGNPEICDAIDDDCDPTTLGGGDNDHDGTVPTLCCNPQPDGTTLCGRDCDDADPSISLLATEICDRIDNDCDGNTDENVQSESWPDFDHDGYGDASATPDIVCTVPSSRANQGHDCNDTSAAVHPLATELCNGVDDDCDGTTDEGASADCTRTGSTMECISARCTVIACDRGHFDCNGVASDGCEASLCDQSDQCGVCGTSCGTGARLCGDGQCVLTVDTVEARTGLVTDAITGAPVVGATVTTVDICPEVTATTLANGTFSLAVRTHHLPRWVRITAPGYATHVQPLSDPNMRIFSSTIVDAWRADPDASVAPSSARAIFVTTGDAPDMNAFYGAHLGPSNTYSGGDLGHLVGGYDGTVFMGAQPGRMQAGGRFDTGGGCSSICTPSYDLWLEPGAVTHIPSGFMCGGVC
ncbi:MAG: MopE-related protein [Sandaracinus sp.]